MITIDIEKARKIDRDKLQNLTKRKFQLYMLDNGLLDAIESTIDAIEDPLQKRRMQIEYSSPDDFERLSSAVQYMSELMGWTDEQMDMMWKQALTL